MTVKTTSKNIISLLAMIVVFSTSQAVSQQALNDIDIANAKGIRNLANCLKTAGLNGKKGIDYAIDWRTHFGGEEADYCLGISYIEDEQYEHGANYLSNLAIFTPDSLAEKKSKYLSQAANAYMLAQLPDKAFDKIQKAVELSPKNADLLVDRARINAMLEKWHEAEADLTQAMDIRNANDFILRLRAEARLQQSKYDSAEEDIKRAILYNSKEAQNYYVRGRIREARRLGHAPE
jgi:tetratricopeptide (TPR) repeat protein